jgi:DNA-binding transcriptional regulator YdaS (Cro superfamily)
MIDIHTVRRHNLHALLQAHAQAKLRAGESAKGVEASFAALLQVSPSLLSQLKSSRPISDKLAAQIEVATKRGLGSLSVASSDTDAQAKARFLELAEKQWDRADAAQRAALIKLLKQ